MKLRDKLKNVVPRELWGYIPRSYSIIGEVVIVDVPGELKRYVEDIGEAILEAHKNVRGVYALEGYTSGVYRIRPLKLIAGEEVESTIHKEYGVKLHVKVKSTYFNPSLGHEHYRVSKLVESGERILDMFCGVGGFTVHVAVNKRVRVVAVDLNREAIESLKTSMRINKLKGSIDCIVGDIRVVGGSLRPVFTRIIMDYPEKSVEYLDLACKLLSREGGVIHYYRFSDSVDSVVKELFCKVGKYSRRVVRICSVRRVLEASPSKRMYGVDVYLV